MLLRERMGPTFKLMLDPASHFRTFADALAIGKACDEAKFFWLEDPFRDTGVSQSAHRMLRERVATPLLIGEHIRGLENKADFANLRRERFREGEPGLRHGHHRSLEGWLHGGIARPRR